MITPELESYIKSSRASGISDSQIRQNLLSQGGWTPADLDQAFAAGSAPPITSAARAAVTGGMSIKVIGIIVAVLLIGGSAGAYFVLNKPSELPCNAPGCNGSGINPYPDQNRQEQSNNSTNTKTQVATSAPFHCEDLFPEDSDLVVKFDEKFYP